MNTARVDGPSSPAASAIANGVSARVDADVTMNLITPRRQRRVRRSATSVPLRPSSVLPIPTSTSVDNVLPGSVASRSARRRAAATNGEMSPPSTALSGRRMNPNGDSYLAPSSAPQRGAAFPSQRSSSTSTEILAIAEQLFGQQIHANSSDGNSQQNATTYARPAGSTAEGVRDVEVLGQRGHGTEGTRARRGGLSERRAELLMNPAVEFEDLCSQLASGADGFRVQQAEMGARVEAESTVDGSAMNNVDGWWDFVGEMESEMLSDCNRSDCGSLPNSCFNSPRTSLDGSSFLPASPFDRRGLGSGSSAHTRFRAGSVFEPLVRCTYQDTTLRFPA
ncbi:unnamed protein product [Closterium sp. NIES-54]